MATPVSPRINPATGKPYNDPYASSRVAVVGPNGQPVSTGGNPSAAVPSGPRDARQPYSDVNQLLVGGINPAGAPAPTSPQAPYYTTDIHGRFTSGDPVAYAKGFAGQSPTLGQYQDPTSLAERNAAQSNYGSGIANLDLQENQTKTSFEELANLLTRNKTKNLGSLADSMADRGLSTSGIFLGSTNDVNQNFAEQGAQQTRQRDSQLNEIQAGRVNMSNMLNQALAEADRLAYERRLKAYNESFDAGLKQAQDALRAAGLIA